MVKIVPLSENDLEQAAQLVTTTFRDSEQISMVDAFPFMYSKAMQGQSYGAFEEGKLVAFLGLVPSVIRIGSARLNVFSLGSVCTHPDYRGKGIASATLQEVMKHVDQARASLLIVSGTQSLYTRADCHPFGDVTRFILDRGAVNDVINNNPNENVLIRELKATDWLGLAEVGTQRIARYEQSVWDLASLVKAEAFASCMKMHHKVLVAEEEECIAGFLVFGIPYRHGQKKQPVAIEWAGRDEVVTYLLAEAVKRYDLERLEVPVSWHEQGLIERFYPLSGRKERNLGTVHIVRPERFFSQLRPFLEERNFRLARCLEIRSLENGRVLVNVDGKKEVMESNEFVSLVFDPSPRIKARDALRYLFPIPFPYTGGLNFI